MTPETMDPSHLTLQNIRMAAASLLLYQSVLRHPVSQAWLKVVETLSTQPVSTLSVWQAYGTLFAALAEEQTDWPSFLWKGVEQSDHAFSRQAAAGSLDQILPPLVQAAEHDLHCLQQLADGDLLLQDRLAPFGIPTWWIGDPRHPEWSQSVDALAHHYRQKGVGLCSQFRAFRWEAGQLSGIAQPDPVQIEHIYGNERQKASLCANTEALMAGQPALNVLLYGARGTGKSSLVKALVNRYGDKGLRLVEVSRADLVQLPRILNLLQSYPHSFILFVDDLSFESDETDFKQLKVLLEGDIAAQPPRIRLYATTNRRHLIREFFQDRPGPANDEVHAWDTVQEKLSLRDRFGLTLTFTPHQQSEYLATVRHLLQQLELIDHVCQSDEQLDRQALNWAQYQNGFSGRTARQFVDALQAGILKD